jgi:pimeloyl-ACP methyl ester carboxylesterase
MEPYQPGKIPVLMVHGLLSSPLTWAPMFNDLRADPVLRERYQFWFYLYPSGNPYLATAADLRVALDKLRHDLDPQGQDPALGQMVCVGHSMGGLVSHLLTADSRDDFWRLVSDKPFADVRGRPEVRDELERVFYFDRQPAVRRVVFLGTPHHGSKLSPTLPARLVVQLVRLPMGLADAARELAKDDPDGPGAKLKRLPTSVDLLAPGAAALELLAARPRPEGVHFHSIVGVAPPSTSVFGLTLVSGDRGEKTDGVVPYTSAHLDAAESELVVAADHFHIHHHPRAVLEVRRILLEHLRDLRYGDIQPVSAKAP